MSQLRCSGGILIWVLTHPNNHATSARAVSKTWGSLSDAMHGFTCTSQWCRLGDCDKLLFISSKPDAQLPVVDVGISGPESRLVVWEKTRSAAVQLCCRSHRTHCAGRRGCMFMRSMPATTTGSRECRCLLSDDDDVWGRFMKADDDTYVVVKNLRAFLSQHSPSDLHYYGACLS